MVAAAALAVGLAGLLVPAVTRAREAGRRGTCTSNLKQIYMAVRQYYTDTQRYPISMAPLLPENTALIVSTGMQPLTNGTPERAPGHFGYLRSLSLLVCPDDDNEYNVPHSSYDASGDPVNSVWNFKGYDANGVVPEGDLRNRALLVNAWQNWHVDRNPVRYSLSNRFAPPQTVITHCRYHRRFSTGVRRPDDIYGSRSQVQTARDVILRLDGSARTYDVARFNTGMPLPPWQQQNF